MRRHENLLSKRARTKGRWRLPPAAARRFWPYCARLHGPWPIDGPITVPTGCCEFPRALVRQPCEWAEGVFEDLRRRGAMPRCGHFEALERPEALAAEIAAFFDGLG